MRIKKSIIALFLIFCIGCLNYSTIQIAVADPVESEETLAQYKAAITSRIKELEDNLNNDLNNQVGLLNDVRNIAEYLSYYQFAFRNRQALGFSDTELQYYAERIVQYIDIFDEHYSASSESFNALFINIGLSTVDEIQTNGDATITERANGLINTSVPILTDTLPLYYESCLQSLNADLPSDENEKDLYLRKNAQILAELYKCIIFYQDVPNSLNNITPLDSSQQTRTSYSFDGSGDNGNINNRIAGIVTTYEELLQFGKQMSQKTIDNSLNVDNDLTPIEIFTNITKDDNGNYVFPEDVYLSQAYLAMLSCSSVYTPFKSYVGCSEFSNALVSLAHDDKQATELIKAYTSIKDYRKPLYVRDVNSDGSVTGPAKLITLEDFFDDIKDGSAGALVTVQGDFHYNSEVQSWIYSQNELTYDYSIGTTIQEQSTTEEPNSSDSTETNTTEYGVPTSVNDLNIFSVVEASADELNNSVDVSTNVQMVKTLKNVIFVGDSRTVGLRAAFNTVMPDDSLAVNNVFFVAETGAGYDWFNSTGKSEIDEIIRSHDGVQFTIVFNLGVNDLNNVTTYISTINSLAASDWSNHKIVYESIGAVDEALCQSHNYNVKNSDIASFNSAIESALAQNVNYVDVTSDMIAADGVSLSAGYSSNDGLHYNQATTFTICKNVIIASMDNNQTTSSSNDNDNSTVISEDSTTEQLTQDTELVQDDLEKAIYAYDTITDETNLTQPVLFYGTKYRRAIDNTTTAIMQNILSNTVNLSAVEDIGSRYLYINVFGDIVTDDNLVILPGIANPLIYTANRAYNPYNVAFMNSYPALINRGLYFQVSSSKDVGKYVMLSENIEEDISSSPITLALITSNNDIAETNMFMSVSIEDTFYTNTYNANIILSGQRCVFNSVDTWQQSDLVNYNVIMQSYNPVINEKVIFPYNSLDDTDYTIAKVIAKNSYEYLAFDLTTNSYGNNGSLNDNYIAHNIIISSSFGDKNPKGYSDSKAYEFKQYLKTKKEQIEENVVNLSDSLIKRLGNVEGAIGMNSAYEDPILGRVLRIARENFLMILIIVLLILMIAFLKFHRDLFQIVVLSGFASLLLILFVYLLPIYLPMIYNFLIDKTSSTIAYRVIGMNTDKDSTENYTTINIDSDGNYKFNSASLTLYKVDPTELASFYNNMRISAEDVSAGKTEILNQESGLFIEGDSIKININILFENLAISGRYTTTNGTYCWQLKAYKTVSNNLDYYTPYYAIVDNYIDKLNSLAQVYDLPRSTTTYANGATKDNYLVYSYTHSPVFLTPGQYSFIEQEDAAEYMMNYEDFVEESLDLEASLSNMFGSNTDWLGVAPIFTQLSEESKKTLWAQTMQKNGYYDKNWKPDDEKINQLIVYINEQTRDFIYDFEPEIGKLSDETMIKLIALRANIAFNQEVSKFRNWLYPFSVDYSEMTLNDVLISVFVDDYNKYIAMDTNIANYVGKEHGWFVLILFDLLVFIAFAITNIVKFMIPILYLLFLLILLIRFMMLGDIKIPIKGYLKVSFSLFITYTIFNMSFWLASILTGKVWAIVITLMIDILVLWIIINTVLSVFMNVLDFGDREISTKLVAIGDRLKLGDVFNNIRFNLSNANFVRRGNRFSRELEKRESRYSFDSSVDSIYQDRRL